MKIHPSQKLIHASLLILLLFNLSQSLKGQDNLLIKGKVISSEDRSALAGVSIQLKGSREGTLSQEDGSFSLKANAQSILVFTSLGYQRQELVVVSEAPLEIALSPQDQYIDQVVITAVGIENKKRAINYTLQTLNKEDVTRTAEPNLVASLSGKVAGVQVNTSSGQPGSSATIRTRGTASILGDNSPLFILDGIPIDNSNIGLSIQNANQIVNQSNRAVDLNPNDIESITVLKGPAAAALYGIRASNGAVIVTSKKGKFGADGKKTGISFYSSLTSEGLSRRLQPVQTKFGQGVNGLYVEPGQNGSEDSWGPLLDTLTYSSTPSKWDANGAIVGQSNPLSNGIPVNRYDNLGTFFQPGYTSDNHLSITGGGNRSSFYLSAGRLYQSGIVPTTDFYRNTVRIGAEFLASDKLLISSSIGLYNTGSHNRMLPAGAPSGVIRGLINTPLNFDNSNGLADPANDAGAYTFADGTQRAYSGGNRGFDSPYWSLNKNPHPDQTNRAIAVEQLDYTFNSWLKATARIGTDVSYETRKGAFSKGSIAFPAGIINDYSFFRRDLNTDFYLTLSRNFSSDLTFRAIVGHNFYDSYRENKLNQGNNLNLPDFYNISNASTFNISQTTTRRRLVAGYGDFQFGYKDWLFLAFSGRNEWTSTLQKGQNSFFYPSVSAGWVVSDALKFGGKAISFVKLRASYGQVGNDAQPYSLDTYLGAANFSGSVQGQTLNFPFNGTAGYSINNSLGNKNLKPERITAYELGTDLYFFDNRLRLDVSVYRNESRDQILPVTIPASTGYTSIFTNAGLVVNQGVELFLTGSLVKRDDFNWDVTLNFAHNRNEVVELVPGLNRIALFNTNGAEATAFVGYPFGVFYGTKLLEDAQGRTIVDDRATIDGKTNANFGFPMVDPQQALIGDPNPLWNAGLRNTFQYKSLSLSFLVDNRYQFDIFNSGLSQMYTNGVAKETEDRYDQQVFEGVKYSDGVTNDISVVPGERWYRSLIQVPDVSLEKDLWWIRLRDISLNYSLPQAWVKPLGLSALDLGLTGRNVFILTNYTGQDPDINLRGGSTNGSSSDFFGYPTTRSIGGSVRLSF